VVTVLSLTARSRESRTSTRASYAVGGRARFFALGGMIDLRDRQTQWERNERLSSDLLVMQVGVWNLKGRQILC
jgi:hypothetical protein